MTASNLRELVGGDKLTDAEVDVLRDAALGMTAQRSAEHLGYALDTVKGRRKLLVAKLETNNLLRAVVVGIATGVLNIDDLVDLDL